MVHWEEEKRKSKIRGRKNQQLIKQVCFHKRKKNGVVSSLALYGRGGYWVEKWGSR